MLEKLHPFAGGRVPSLYLCSDVEYVVFISDHWFDQRSAACFCVKTDCCVFFRFKTRKVLFILTVVPVLLANMLIKTVRSENKIT